MKRRRLRFSIAGIMLLVLLVAAGFGLKREAEPRPTPSLAEWAADRDYKSSVVRREAAERRLKRFESSLIPPRVVVEDAVAGRDGRSVPNRPAPDAAPTTVVIRADAPGPRAAATRDEDRRTLREAVTRARAAEDDAYTRYRRERDRRLRRVGF